MLAFRELREERFIEELRARQRQRIIDRLLADAHRAVEGRAHDEDTPE